MQRVFLPALLFLIWLPFAEQNSSATRAQTLIDQMVRDNINTRRRAEVYKSRRQPAGKKKATANGQRTPPARRGAPPTSAAAKLATVYFGLDPYQRFSDGGFFTVNFTFSPASGGASFTKSFNYADQQSVSTAKFTDIPPGNYRVTAQATRKNGKRSTVFLATRAGEPSDPNGGDFAASIGIAVKPGKDYYGNNILASSPETIYIRVLD